MERKPLLKDSFVKSIIADILSGNYTAGSILPSERELSEKMSVSRTVVRSGLAELSAIGLIKTVDRVGSIVQNVEYNASMPVIDAILSSQGKLSPKLMQGFLEARKLIEGETARLAAINRSDEDLYQLYGLIRREQEIKAEDVAAHAEMSFQLHQRVAYAGGNPIYPILLGTMQSTYELLLKQYYSQGVTPEEVIPLHRGLYDAILSRKPDLARQKMMMILEYRV